MKAGMEVFRAFAKDADDFAELAATKLQMPLLVLSGEKAGGPFLIEQGKMVASAMSKACSLWDRAVG
jgi:hypothetical protein